MEDLKNALLAIVVELAAKMGQQGLETRSSFASIPCKEVFGQVISMITPTDEKDQSSGILDFVFPPGKKRQQINELHQAAGVKSVTATDLKRTSERMNDSKNTLWGFTAGEGANFKQAIAKLLEDAGSSLSVRAGITLPNAKKFCLFLVAYVEHLKKEGDRMLAEHAAAEHAAGQENEGRSEFLESESLFDFIDIDYIKLINDKHLLLTLRNAEGRQEPAWLQDNTEFVKGKNDYYVVELEDSECSFLTC